MRFDCWLEWAERFGGSARSVSVSTLAWAYYLDQDYAARGQDEAGAGLRDEGRALFFVPLLFIADPERLRRPSPIAAKL